MSSDSPRTVEVVNKRAEHSEEKQTVVVLIARETETAFLRLDYGTSQLFGTWTAKRWFARAFGSISVAIFAIENQHFANPWLSVGRVATDCDFDFFSSVVFELANTVQGPGQPRFARHSICRIWISSRS